MVVSLPQHPCYYYECSNGSFRLTYFIPPAVLKSLSSKGNISRTVLEDFPDGVDLDCTEPDFADFYEQYKFRPEDSPESLCNAFFAIFSTTHNWTKFRGTGFICAEQIESILIDVDATVRKTMAAKSEATQPEPTLKERRRRIRQRATQQTRVESSLEKWKVEGVNPKKKLHEQDFTPVQQFPAWSTKMRTVGGRSGCGNDRL